MSLADAKWYYTGQRPGLHFAQLEFHFWFLYDKQEDKILEICSFPIHLKHTEQKVRHGEFHDKLKGEHERQSYMAKAQAAWGPLLDLLPPDARVGQFGDQFELE